MNSQSSVINVSGDYEETILRFAKHLGKDKNRRAVFNIIYGRGSRPRSKKQIAEALGKAGNAQVIQNALDELSKHHLIVRLKNEGLVKDGSRWVYEKSMSVRANRDKIVRYADDPNFAKKVSTKRNPKLDILLSMVKSTPQRRSASSAKRRKSIIGTKFALKIALLVTNPDRRASLQTGVEARYIDEGIKLAGQSESVDLKAIIAPTLNDLIDALNSYQPQIVHFSGHGGGGALVFDNERAGDDGGTVLDFDMIARVILATTAKPHLLVLAACDTVNGAEQFLDATPAVVAMSDSIDDDAACEFSARFYRSLTGGATIRNSLTQAKILLEHKGYADAQLPELIAKDIKAGDHVFLSPGV